jgi:hypothetical protein
MAAVTNVSVVISRYNSQIDHDSLHLNLPTVHQYLHAEMRSSVTYDRAASVKLEGPSSHHAVAWLNELTDSPEYSSSLEVDNCDAGQEIPCILNNMKVFRN